MKRSAATFLALAALLAGASAAQARTADVFGDLNASAPRSIFDTLRETAPRSPFDALNETAPRSLFDSIRDSAPRSAGDGASAPDLIGE